MTDIADIFHQRIYSGGGWRDHPCGTGSTMPNTRELREHLPDAVLELGVRSMLDAPCGDHSWIQHVEWKQPMYYIGGDCVPALIEANRAAYPQTDFLVMDITHDPLPYVDLMLVRDCLIHLTNDQISAFLTNFVNWQITWLAVTNYDVAQNTDINVGSYRPVNLRAEPFGLPEPHTTWPDSVDINGGPRNISVWHRDQIAAVLDKRVRCC
jgi:hypothetical protein